MNYKFFLIPPLQQQPTDFMHNFPENPSSFTFSLPPNPSGFPFPQSTPAPLDGAHSWFPRSPSGPQEWGVLPGSSAVSQWQWQQMGCLEASDVSTQPSHGDPVFLAGKRKNSISLTPVHQTWNKSLLLPHWFQAGSSPSHPAGSTGCPILLSWR